MSLSLCGVACSSTDSLEPEASDGVPGGDPGDVPGASGGSPSAPPIDPEKAFTALNTRALRLTQTELRNVLEDAFGVSVSTGFELLAEDDFSPFDNDFDSQAVSSALVESLEVFSETVAAEVVSKPEFIQSLPCAAATEAACFAQITQELGGQLLRRSLTADDVDRYQVLLSVPAPPEQPNFSIQLLIRALVQDPDFLYRAERGTPTEDPNVFQLTSAEVATRMAFLLTGRGPDAPLLAKAEDAGLLEPELRRASAERLLLTDAAKRQLYRFHSMWLGYRTLPHAAELNAEFQAETQALIERAALGTGSYMELFTSDDTFLTPSLAEHYGLPEPSGAEGWVTYPADSGRAGILAHGSVLSAFAKFTDTSPTQRGIFVRTRLLCEDIPSPPPTVDVDQPPEGEEGACKVARYQAHQEQSGCAGCHALFDPIGLGLENFDRAGRFRETDDDNPDCAIDIDGELPGYGSFRSPAELSGLLTDNSLIEGCLVQHFMRYTLGQRTLTARQLKRSGELTERFGALDNNLTRWLVEYVESDSFALREVGEEQ